jgi:hypothetical protein
MKILILGGYGTFGGRLAQLLAGEERLTLLVAGRSQAKAAAFCQGLAARACTVPLAFDRDGDLETQLRAAAPGLVVDASGPFQTYGDDPYRVVKACIALGIDYLDLADGADFVAGISAFDGAARERGIYALSGVSSFPVLTAAVVRRLTRSGDTLETIAAGIAPSPYAGVGLNVIRAVAGYGGKRVAVVRGGRAAHAYALVDSMHFAIAPPGHLPLDRIRFSLVDVPDLRVLPALWPSVKSVWVGAGPVPAILHRGLSMLAWLVRVRLLPSLAPLAKLFHFAINHLRWGDDRGGMFVAVTGRDLTGKPFARDWHMLAEGADGPLIPSMGCAAIVGRVLEDKRPAAGARAAVGDLQLEDYEAQFANRPIVAGVRGETGECEAIPMFERILGDAWHLLPEPIRALHASDGRSCWKGSGSVERGGGLLARFCAALMRFPRATASVPLQLDIVPQGRGVRWRRSFGDRSFSSLLAVGRGRFDRLLIERFGPMAFGVALVLEGPRLRYIVRRWSVFGIPMPSRWAPGGITREFDDRGRFGFDVELRHSLTGLIVRYKGWLVPARDEAEEARP